jgi:glycosyltransferase involved in cell wall biosynthesis
LADPSRARDYGIMTGMRPRLGIVAHAPIQYHTPLFQLLAKRNRIDLDVLFLSDRGVSATVDPEFGSLVSWDIDLLSGYHHRFLTTRREPFPLARRIIELVKWLPRHDAIVVNGYNSGWMILTMIACRVRGIPYILRASSHPQGPSTGWRRHARKLVTRLVVAGSSADLAMGDLNTEFYRQNHGRTVVFAPNSVDNERFARTPSITRDEALAKWNLNENAPVIMFSGKLIPRKRPFDIISAIKRLPTEVNMLFVGEGELAEDVKASLSPVNGAVTGFINQSDLPVYYHAADIIVLPSEDETWGLVVNEAMAAGTLPVVSDRVGCAPDLVKGIGEIYPCGNVKSLAAALIRSLEKIKKLETRDLVRQHVARYSLDRTAIGYEQGAMAVYERAKAHKRRSTASEA